MGQAAAPKEGVATQSSRDVSRPKSSGEQRAISEVEGASSGVERASSGAEQASSGAERASSGAEQASSGAERASSGAEQASSGAAQRSSRNPRAAAAALTRALPGRALGPAARTAGGELWAAHSFSRSRRKDPLGLRRSKECARGTGPREVGPPDPPQPPKPRGRWEAGPPLRIEP